MTPDTHMTCEEVIAFVADYIDHALDDGLLSRFEWHLERCASCRNYLAAYRDTIAIAREAERPLTPLLAPPEDLVQAILLARENAGGAGERQE